MPVRIDWDNPTQTILYVRYAGRWTWEEFYDAAKECQVLSATVNHPVYIIADMIGGFLPKGAPFSHSERVMANNNRNLGFVVVVSGNRFIQGLMNVSARMIPRWREQYRVANTVEEARAIIERERQAAYS